MTNNKIKLAYELDAWNNYGAKIPIVIDISPAHNSHILMSGMSGAGKSYAEELLFYNLVRASGGEFHFADFKGDDSFAHLRGCANYYQFKNTLEALDIVYERLNARLSGEDDSRNPVTLIWDEYMANMLSLINEDKKRASEIMNRVSEILLMGRSMSVRLICSCQRPDALAFPAGARINYGIVQILGASVRSIYEMLLPDHREQVEGRIFNRGEGVALLQGTELKFIKIPTVRDVNAMRQRCINALS